MFEDFQNLIGDLFEISWYWKCFGCDLIFHVQLCKSELEEHPAEYGYADEQADHGLEYASYKGKGIEEFKMNCIEYVSFGWSFEYDVNSWFVVTVAAFI